MTAPHFLCRFVLTIGLGFAGWANAEVVGWWRFDSVDKGAGKPVVEVANSEGVAGTASRQDGTPLYSDSVPGTKVRDPLSGKTLENRLSVTASGGDQQSLQVPNTNGVLETGSFTIEFFIKQAGAGTQFGWVAARTSGTRGWGLQHGNDNSQNEARARFQTAESREQFIFSHIFLGDEQWHHVALTFKQASPDDPKTTDADEGSGEACLYVDYQLCGEPLLVKGSPGSDLPLILLNPSNSSEPRPFSITMDEIRYSGEALDPEKFLRAEE